MSPGRILQGPFGYGLGSLVRMACLFVLGRLVAQRLGGEGLLAMGQWQNLIGVGVALGGNALQSGLQQGLAVRTDPGRWFGSALVLGQILSFLAAGTCLALAATGAVRVPFGVPGGAALLFVACAAGSLYGNLQAAAAGIGRMERLNLWMALSGAVQLLWLLPFLGTPGRLGTGLLLLPALLALLAWHILPHPASRLADLRLRLREWLPFLSIGLLPGLAAQLMQLQLRQLAMAHDLHQASLWQAGVRLSDTLLPVWSAAATAWALPRLANGGIRPAKALRISLAGTLPLCLGLAAFAPLALDLALGRGFQAAASVLRLQCLVEVVRACTLPLSLLFIARGRAGAYVSLEVGSNLLQLALAAAFLPRAGILALPLAALAENLLYGLVAWRVCKADLRPS